MQALYGYFIALESLKEISKATLESIHALDPAKHDFADKSLFEEKKKLAVQLFGQNVLHGSIETEEKVEHTILANVNHEIQEFHKKQATEARRRRREMIKDTARIYELYVKFLQLPIDLELIEKRYAEKKRHELPTPFVDNEIVKQLKSSKSLQKEATLYQSNWSDEMNELRSWYKHEIVPSTALHDYFIHEMDTTPFVLELFKKIIFKNENIQAYITNQNLQWLENKFVIKSMVLKTIKAMTEGHPFELAELTKNGQEDIDFFTQLYDGVIEKNDFLDQLIASKAHNWEVDRIALIDRIILKMALVEMMTCASIPMKVSINEAIEISKQYSTPKSKQFINGILDVLSNELTLQGKIRKSGRGLIDNK